MRGLRMFTGVLVLAMAGCGGLEKVSLGGDDGGDVGTADAAAPEGSTPDGAASPDAWVPTDAELDEGLWPDGAGASDAGLPPDVGLPSDAGLPPDVGLPSDAGLPPDVGLPSDAGLPPDVGLPSDAGPPPDIGFADAGAVGPDGGPSLCDTCAPGEFCERRAGGESCRVLSPSCTTTPTCACVLTSLGASCTLESCIVDGMGRVRIGCM